jgi:hypothetical protein
MPSAQTSPSSHFVAHRERSRLTWAEETKLLRPASAIMQNWIALWSVQAGKKCTFFSSALRPEENLFWFRVIRVIRLIRLMPGI